VLTCCQLKVSLSDGWTSYDDVSSSSSVLRRHGDHGETTDTDVDVVFDMANAAEPNQVTSGHVEVMFHSLCACTDKGRETRL